ncbi:hypothetical protein GRI44_12805 [Altererythrobacter confluentis]|uniref:OmpR/PhoB-type domain-containing protein n=1 Tax=Allopontixanthobacter confluentis TaxID=1849021 RepID=A0A6L7GJD2_9SPHN|nr:winged helix-turn-helix domain-containing protein [Allopontixanthobacter confluentis]MXP15630.1 hypothetical protein [Allopontixanthobacter confluentis]
MDRASFLAGAEMLPRHFRAGPVMLDLFHRDGSIDGRWLGLHPREFELFWRLAECAGQPLSRKRLLAEVWRIDYDPETNRVEVHVARLRAKLHVFSASWLIVTVPAGYLLDAAAYPVLRTDDCPATPQQYLDSYLRLGNDRCTAEITGDADEFLPE